MYLFGEKNCFFKYFFIVKFLIGFIYEKYFKEIYLYVVMYKYNSY